MAGDKMMHGDKMAAMTMGDNMGHGHAHGDNMGHGHAHGDGTMTHGDDMHMHGEGKHHKKHWWNKLTGSHRGSKHGEHAEGGGDKMHHAGEGHDAMMQGGAGEQHHEHHKHWWNKLTGSKHGHHHEHEGAHDGMMHAATAAPGDKGMMAHDAPKM
eukprot:Unigene3258_Nuclearia_a/m.9997 Unigene3258_Nuclearia_a/g.9997  ORF Unigene3258_Nuclearia_a/g.9997 Unigene3258_Nuclearia_a/m.9997 type:complete len:155 (-) Unigene3258_Nuclearia_a:63-527(-)